MTTATTHATDATDLPPMYDPTTVEPIVLERYLTSKAYAAPGKKIAEDALPYCIVIPPPNVTAALHLGHALNNTLQDILIRQHRMRGFNTLWMPGTDHAGIATQTIVDKRLQQEGKKALKDYKQDELKTGDGREAFIEKVTAWKDEYEAVITNQLKQMGCSCDWDRQRFTMDDQCATAVREAFFQLFKNGLIYRGKRLVNWDPASQTALSDDEVEMETIDGNFYYMKYPLAEPASAGGGLIDPPEFVTVATTRPETMLGDTAVAVNPKDPLRAKYIGKFVKLPIVGRIIPIIGDDYVVIPHDDTHADAKERSDEASGIDPKAKMASGFLKVTPAHDQNDYDIGQRHNLPIINIMAPDASISKDHGWPAEEWEPVPDAEPRAAASGEASGNQAAQFLGLSREEARKQIVIWFKQHDLMQEVRPYRHAVGHSYRSHVPVEPYYTDQWYVKVTDDRLAGAALEAMDPSQRQGGDGFGGAGISFPGGAGVSPAIDPKGRTSPHLLQKTKRRLPHWEQEGSTYFVTFRLAKGQLKDDERNLVMDACFHWHGERANTDICCVMPDHVHLLIHPLRKADGQWHTLSDLLHSIKSFTAHEINKRRETAGQVWQDESFDRIVRDQAEFDEKWQYIQSNPDRAGLVTESAGYPFTRIGESALRADGRRDAHPTGGKAGNPGLTFHPERYAKTFETWHENIRDWCISRQLWWGHRIPVWSGEAVFGDEGPVFGTQTDEWSNAGRICEVLPGSESWASSYLICVRDENDREVIDSLEANGFERDPDVLDTWFSSALWPMSTLGWPEQTPELATWNPSSVLCTAREIITLWVSRMVMFNRYFKAGDLPFDNVFIHAMIQDGHGQKMSKSLGNGVDPMDIIHSHGSDAMRFTLTKMTTQTQDVRLPVDMVDPKTGESFAPKYITSKQGYKVAAPLQEHNGSKMVSSYGAASGEAKATDDIPAARNTSDKFDEGQRFANKLWNAFRFALPLLQSDTKKPEGSPRSPSVGLGLADKWILNQLGKTIETVDTALAEYRFSDYATALYDFFWRDLCDWYIEIVKPTVKEDAAQQQVLATCLDASLRLMHPAMPFITERLFEALKGGAPVSAIPRAPGIALPESEMLIHAAWPVATEALRDAQAERDFETLRSIVEAIRHARNAYKIPPRQAVEATTCAPAAISQLIFNNRNITQPLTRCVGRGVGPKIDKPSGAATVIVGDVTVYLHDVVDTEVEKERLEKALADKEKAVKMFDGRLSNKKYVDNAPAHLVQETRDQQAAAIKERDAVKEQLDELG